MNPPVSKALTRAKIISYPVFILAPLLSLFAIFNPPKGSSIISTILAFALFTIFPYLTLIISVKSAEKFGQGNFTLAILSLIAINTLYGFTILYTITNSTAAGFIVTLILAPFMYLVFKILLALKNNIIAGTGKNPTNKKLAIAYIATLTLMTLTSLLLK
jgi:hypothetical protein